LLIQAIDALFVAASAHADRGRNIFVRSRGECWLAVWHPTRFASSQSARN